MTRKLYTGDVSDDEWAFVAPCLTLMTEDAPQQEHSLREVFNGLPYIVRGGLQWRLMPHDLPSWHHGSTSRRNQAPMVPGVRVGVFEDIVRDLRMLATGLAGAEMRKIEGRNPQPRAAIFNGRTFQSTPESGGRAGYDGHMRRKGSKVHMTVDKLCQLLAAIVPSADEQERVQVDALALAAQVQEATGDSVEVAFVDQGYTGEQAATDAEKHGIRL